MLYICLFFMTSYCFSEFLLAYYYYIEKKCMTHRESCKQLSPFAAIAILSMVSVFIIDNICSVVLLISVWRIYETIEKFFPDQKANKCVFALHVTAFVLPNIVQIVIIILAIVDLNQDKDKNFSLAMANGFSTFFFFILQLSFALV